MRWNTLLSLSVNCWTLKIFRNGNDCDGILRKLILNDNHTQNKNDIISIGFGVNEHQMFSISFVYCFYLCSLAEKIAQLELIAYAWHFIFICSYSNISVSFILKAIHIIFCFVLNFQRKSIVVLTYWCPMSMQHFYSFRLYFINIVAFNWISIPNAIIIWWLWICHFRTTISS